jgi:hypothetical protein
MLRRIFGPKRDEVTGEWRRLHNEELYAMFSPNSIQVIKSRKMRWTGHVARMQARRCACTEFWWGNLREEDHSEEPRAGRRIILKRELGGGGAWTG